MRQIVLKYGGECQKCNSSLLVGQKAGYEKHVGIFCPDCTPSETEDIRAYRQEAADKRADRYGGWAAKRRERATATLSHNREHYTSDIAFNTQPGHIPIRARVIAQNDRAMESLAIADKFESKAERLRDVRVAGDRERERQVERDAVRARLTKGMTIHTPIYGRGIVERINKKTATVTCFDTASGNYRTTVDLSWIKILDQIADS